MRGHNRRIEELFEEIRTTMPQGNPGGLDRALYFDIVTYLLQANGMNSLTAPLSDNPQSRKLLEVEIH